jgi:predicted DNA-binding antitoxin AbrB/MazE fold protein
MSQHITAIYENGVLKPLEPLDLQEQELVSLAIDKVHVDGDEGTQEGGTLFDVMNEAGLVGCIKNAPSDLSTNAKYLEGFGKSGS